MVLKDIYKMAIKGIGKVHDYKNKAVFYTKNRAQLLGRLLNDEEVTATNIIFQDEEKFNLRKQYGRIAKTGKVSARLTCPPHIIQPDYENEIIPEGIEIKTPEQISCMRRSCKLARYVLNAAEQFIRPGITTDELDKHCHDLIIRNGAYPSPLGFEGFPKSICTSVNNIVVHGIPDDRLLQNGDIISVDITVYLNGYHGDCAATFLVGAVNYEGVNLVKHAEAALYAGISKCRPDAYVDEIADAITVLAEENEYEVVPAVMGHGIGQYFHGPPSVCHSGLYVENFNAKMQPGMVFTIEPAISEGTRDTFLLDDNWTLSTEDGSRCAQFEHTVLITESGVEILTK